MASLDDLFSTSFPPRARVLSPRRSASPSTPARRSADPLFFSPRSPSPPPQPRAGPSRPPRPSRPAARGPDGPDDFDAYGAETFGMAEGVFDDPNLGAALDPLDPLALDPLALGAEDKPRKVRAPIAKVDYDRLTGENGFPALMRAAKRFKVKGKGHEAADLARLLDVYQLWAHRMFPKGDFAHTIGRIEAVCRSRRMHSTLEGYRDAFNPPPTPPRDDGAADVDVDADIAAAEADAADANHGSPSRAHKRRRSSPLFDPYPDAELDGMDGADGTGGPGGGAAFGAGGEYDGPDEDELAELAAMEADEARAAGPGAGGGAPGAGAGPEDEWDDDLYA